MVVVAAVISAGAVVVLWCYLATPIYGIAGADSCSTGQQTTHSTHVWCAGRNHLTHGTDLRRTRSSYMVMARGVERDEGWEGLVRLEVILTV